jgi:hypothetical protein
MIPRWFAFAVLACVFALATVTMADPDLWGHVRFGLDMLDTRTLPSVDPYSFTQDRPWINHEWLSEVQMGAAYRLAGPAGLALLKGALVTAAWLIVLGSWRGVDTGPRILMFAAIAAGTARLTLTMRPQIWSFLIFAILCSELARADSRRVRWLPVLFAIWANVHGGWVLGLGVAGAWWAAAWVQSKARLFEAAILWLACAAATLVTPYGVGLWQFIADTVRLGRDIGEWQPVWTTPPANWVVWLGAGAASSWTIWRSPRMRWPAFAVLLMLGYSSFQVERLVPFFVVAAAVFASAPARERWPARPQGRPLSAGDRRIAAGFAAALVAAGLWIVVRSTQCVSVAGDWVPDSAGAAVLARAQPGRLVTFFDWGQYAIWHLGPRLRVSYDGRRETVYSPKRRVDHDALLRGTDAGARLLAEWNPESVWLPAWNPAAKGMLDRAGYRLEPSGAASLVASRRDLSPLSSPVAAESSGRRCFPR